jgi:hypothetical protein
MTSRVWLAPFLATLVRPNLRSKRESGYHLKPLKTNYEEAWCAQGDELRTFLVDFVASVTKVEFPAGLSPQHFLEVSKAFVRLSD